MYDTSTVKTEKTLKILALCAGIMIGSFYASFGRSIARQWIFAENTGIRTSAPSSIEMDKKINETAAFLVPDDTTLADRLAKEISVLCWIHRDDISSDLIDAIKSTWGGRCTRLLFLSNNENKLSDVVNLKVNPAHKPNVVDAYKYILAHHADNFDNFDWFLKTDGDTYVVMENLRYMLYSYDPQQSIAFGHRVNSTWTASNTSNAQTFTYYSDAAGYVMSKGAMKRLDGPFSNGTNCAVFKEKKKHDNERIGMCMSEAGILDGNSLDEHGKKRFFEIYLDTFLLPKVEVNFPYPWYGEYKVDHRLDAASNYSITFHGMSTQKMHVMEYLIYQLRPYGLEYEMPPLPQKMFKKSNETTVGDLN